MIGHLETPRRGIIDHIETPRDVVTYKLGAALEMAHTIVEMLGRLQRVAKGADVGRHLHAHAEATQAEIGNLEQAFAALGARTTVKPCLAMDALDEESRVQVGITEDGLVDVVVLAGAEATGQYEIGVYRALVAQAEALGQPDVAALMRDNLRSAQRTDEDVRRATRATLARWVQPVDPQRA